MSINKVKLMSERTFGVSPVIFKKCVNICRNKIPHNSAKICEKNVKFSLKIVTILSFFFGQFFCCQMASRVYTSLQPPTPLSTMCKKTSDLVEEGFPYKNHTMLCNSFLITLNLNNFSVGGLTLLRGCVITRAFQTINVPQYIWTS